MTARLELALRTTIPMGTRSPLVPLPAPLVPGIAALRLVQPPPRLEEELRARLQRTADEHKPPKRRLVLIGTMLLGLLMELSPVLVAAQEATPEVEPQREEAEPAAAADATPPAADLHLAGAVATDPHTLDVRPDAAPAAHPRAAATAIAPTDPPTAPAHPTPGVAEDYRLSASFDHGVRFEAPQLADLTIELHSSIWLRADIERAQHQTADYFSVPLARIALATSVFDGLVRFFIQPELAGTPRLLDAHLDVVIDPALALRVGQFRTPFSRSFITSILALQLPDRGAVVNAFHANRDTGIMLYGRPFGGLLEYDVGVFNGSGIDGRLGDTPAPMVVGRLAITPFGSMPYAEVPSLVEDDPAGLMIGVNGYFRELAPDPAMPNVVQQTASGGADVAFAWGPFSLQTEAFLRWQRVGVVDPFAMSWGVYGQAGVFVVPRILQLTARGGWMDPNADPDDDPATDLDGDLVQTYEAAVAGYLALDGTTYGQHLKLILAYRYADAGAPVGDVPVGRSHRVTAFAQLFF